MALTYQLQIVIEDFNYRSLVLRLSILSILHLLNSQVQNIH